MSKNRPAGLMINQAARHYTSSDRSQESIKGMKERDCVLLPRISEKYRANIDMINLVVGLTPIHHAKLKEAEITIEAKAIPGTGPTRIQARADIHIHIPEDFNFLNFHSLCLLQTNI